MPKPLLIVVGGPTASGKTSLAIALAEHFKTQILSADSRQCYRELNIGVAKPTLQQLESVQHYFINSHSIHEAVNAGVYEQYGLNALEKIFSENKVAVLVGGTGLYIDALLHGIDNIPVIPDEVRKELQHKYEQRGLSWLQRELQIKDPTHFQNIEQHNPQRLLRALEVVEFTGKSISSFQNKQTLSRSFDTIKITPLIEREILYSRIHDRTDEMMNDGLLREAESLFPYKHLNALQTVGYKELFDYMEGKFLLDTAIEEIKKNTRHYAKRQITWFKNKDQYEWLSFDDVEKIIQLCEKERNKK